MTGISLTRFLIEEQRAKAQIGADLRLLIEVVARACKTISIAVGKGALGEHRDPARDLGIPVARRWVGYGMNHWDLLSRPEVYAEIS